MKIEDTQSRTIKIWGLPHYYDLILVNISNTYPGAGRLTLTGDNDSWSYFWGAMGEDRTLEQFLLDTNVDYIVMKLGNGISSTLDERDDEECARAIQLAILKARRRGDITKNQAYEAWLDIQGCEDIYRRWQYTEDFCATGLVDEDDIQWPEPPENPAYKRLEYAVIQMRAALTTLKEKSDAVPA